MSARTRTLLPLFLAAGLVVAAGCKTRPYPIKFNNDMARAVDKLNKAGRDFYFAVLPLSKGAEVDPKEVRSKYQAVEKTLKEIKENYEEIAPPMGTTSGSDLMDRFMDFLDGQQTLLDKYLTPILQKVEDNRLNPEDKWAAIKPLLDKMDDEEKQTRAPLEDVQKKWGEEHHLRLDK